MGTGLSNVSCLKLKDPSISASSLTASEFNAKALTQSLKKKTAIPIVWGRPTASC